MIFQISRTEASPEFESLPVAKITRYPLEKADYKPYAQCCACIMPDRLALRMWAFELDTSYESELRAVFYLWENKPGASLHVKISPPAVAGSGNLVEVMVKDAGTSVALPFEANPHNGEDLQGVYWGSEVFIPLAGEMAQASLQLGGRFQGNFFKIRTGKMQHFGSWAPADFTQDPFSRNNMGEFAVVSY